MGKPDVITARRYARLAVFLILLVAGCGESPREHSDYEPVAIEPGDECHVCGMIITRFPGPKGEAFVRHGAGALKFCSTRDLFSWLLQPGTANQVEAIYVHDMAESEWDSPPFSAMVDARTAWYVAGSDRHGAMGPTLASFAQRAAAERFAERHGGRVVDFAAIDLVLLQSLASPAEPGHAGQ